MLPDGWRKLPFIAAITALIAGCKITVVSDSDSDTQPSDWEGCPEQIGGNWAFGRAPYGCDVEVFGSADVVRTDFSAYIFDDAQPRDEERIRYMGELHAFLGDEAGAYMRSRKPAVTDAEINAWRHAVYTAAHQESFWTHYREAQIGGDPFLTMIRGDQGHGHGLMQIDDRYHTAAIDSGSGWRLDDNLIYALDIYYQGWQRAPGESCVIAATNWDQRARAAYSAYNGGPGQICRWTDPDDPWAQNDEGYYDKYTRQEWTLYVAP